MIDSQVEIRKRARQARASSTPRERSVASRKICERFAHSRLFESARHIACYVPLHDEVDTWPLIERAYAQKKRVFAPVTQENFRMTFRELPRDGALMKNRMGLLEPVEGAEIDTRLLDIVVTPLVAFDNARSRIGMGGGYYDRAFAFLKDSTASTNPLLVGVAFDCQRVEKIAPNPWDIRLFRIITESSVY